MTSNRKMLDVYLDMLEDRDVLKVLIVAQSLVAEKVYAPMFDEIYKELEADVHD